MSEHTNPNPYRRATAVAVSVIGMGLVASVAGNFQSIILDAKGADGPSVGAMISAVWWPALLFAMIELAIHTPWGDTRAWRTVQWLGAGIIGGLAFYISYFHLAHVLSYFGYDVVSRYAGPITVDVAMMVATLALHRIGVAKRKLATEDEALAKAAALATMATEMAKDLVATGQDEVATEPVATPEPVGQADPLAAVATDWADLDTSWDEDLARMTAEAQAAPEPAPAAEPAQDATEAPEPATLTTVPAEAAKRIREILDEAPATTGVAIAQALMDAGLASSSKTGRRYAAAVKNGTARVS